MTERAVCENAENVENVKNIETDAYLQSDVEKVWRILCADKKKAWVVIQITPAARVILGEKFGFARGEDATMKAVAVLKGLGADVVTDTAIAVDAVVFMQTELLKQRKENGGRLPLYSAECPVFVQRLKEEIAEYAEDVSVSSSEISARLLRSHYENTKEAWNKRICIVSVEACAAKKQVGGADVVLTVEELWEILESTEVDLRLGRKAPLDAPLGVSSGAAYVCAISGGYAESVARCLISDKTRMPIKKLAYSGLYGRNARREATITEGETEWKFAVVSDIDEGVALLNDVKNGSATYDFVEVTGRAGGAIGGYLDGLAEDEATRTRRLRALGLHYMDRNHAARSADMSSAVAAVVKEWEAMCRSGEAYKPVEEIDFTEIDEVIEVAEVVEEPAIEEAAEVVEEPAVEEAAEVVEEPAIEEAEEVVEEPAVEEVAEVVEEPAVEEAEEVVEEPVAEEAAEVVEEPAIEEVAEVVEEPVAEEAAEVVEEPAIEEVTEVVEEPAIEEVVEVVEEPAIEEAEEVVEEPAIEEVALAAVEEPKAEEVDGNNGRSPYYVRLSTKEKNRLKRKNKKK